MTFLGLIIPGHIFVIHAFNFRLISINYTNIHVHVQSVDHNSTQKYQESVDSSNEKQQLYNKISMH